MSRLQGLHWRSSSFLAAAEEEDAVTGNILPPNVVVAHVAAGMEVLALHSGRPLTHLRLDTNAVPYADCNGDGKIDAAWLHTGRHTQTVKAGASRLLHLPPCSLVVRSGIPPKYELWNVSACSPPVSAWSRLQMQSDGGNSASGSKATISVDDGLIQWVRSSSSIPSTKSSSSTTPSHSFDLLVLLNDGLLTLYSPEGVVLWSLKSRAVWKGKYRQAAGLVPSVTLFNRETHSTSARDHGESILVLAMGATDANIIDSSGYSLAAFRLPEFPVADPVIGDFNQDGTSDIIFVTAKAMHGFSVTSRPLYLVYPVFILILLGVVLVLYIMDNLSDERKRWFVRLMED